MQTVALKRDDDEGGLGTAIPAEEPWTGADFVIARLTAADGSQGVGEAFMWLPESAGRSSRRRIIERAHFLVQLGTESILLHFEVVVRLEIEPEPLRETEVTRESQGGIRCDRALAEDDRVDPAWLDIDVSR